MSLNQTFLQQIKDCLRVVPNYPTKGVNFRDIQPLLSSPVLLDYACQVLASNYTDTNQVTCVAGLDARGFIFGSLIAQKLGVGFVMLRKPSKLPGETHSVSYGLEYGQNVLHVQKDAIKPTDKVLVVDDILVTGGSVEAACQLIEKCGAKVVGVCCLADILLPLEEGQVHGRARLSKYNIKTLVTYEHDTPVPVVASPSPVVPSERKQSNNTGDTRTVILYYPTMEPMAMQMAASQPLQFKLGHVAWDKFPDGYPNVSFDAKSLENRDVIFLGSLYDIGTVMQQYSLAAVLPRQHIRSFNIVFPYFAPGTMERVEREGVLATAETFARILGASIPPCKSGPASLRIYDIHALPNRFYFPDNVTLRMLTATDILKMSLPLSHITIAFPDEGAFKRFKPAFEGFPMIVCSKVRDGEKRVVKITERINCQPNFLETDEILIVDDLVQTGGTLFECRQALVAEGAKRVSAYVTHAVFPNNCYTRFMPHGDRAGFHRFYVTDSVPEVASKLDGCAPFQVIRLGEHLASDIELFCKRTKVPASTSEIVVASSSAIKISAAESAVRSIKDSNRRLAVVLGNVVPQETKSLVPNQPFGNQTYIGAYNRLTEASKSDAAKYRPVLAIETGIFYDTIAQQWYDQSVVLLRTRDGEVHQSKTARTPIPDRFMKTWFESRGKPDAPDTIGHIIANEFTNVTHDDWYKALDANQKSRAQLLQAAIKMLLCNIVVMTPGVPFTVQN